MTRIRRGKCHDKGARTSILGNAASTLAGAFAVSSIFLLRDASIKFNDVYHRRAQSLNGYVQRSPPRSQPIGPVIPSNVVPGASSSSAGATCTVNPELQAQPRDHPHAGARDACGNYGYIHDPKSVFEFSRQIDYVPICNARLGKGSEKEGGALALQKIKIAEPVQGPLRLLCVVYSVDTPAHNEMVQAVLDTWGQKCDGFLVASNVTNPSIGAVDIPHLGDEDYNTVWQKVRSTWSYVHDNYLDDYDFVYIAGEDSYVIVENLRQIIQQAHEGRLYKDPNWVSTDFREVEHWEEDYARTGLERPLYLGGIYPFTKNRYVCAGGAGYVLNRPAIRRMIQNFPYTQPDKLSSREDFFVAAALRNQSVACSDTRDSTGAWRFHHLDAEFQYNYKNHGRPAPWKKGEGVLERTRGIQERLSLDGISEHSVTFHLTTFKKRKVTPERLYRYHAILYGHCPNMGKREQVTMKK